MVQAIAVRRQSATANKLLRLRLHKAITALDQGEGPERASAALSAVIQGYLALDGGVLPQQCADFSRTGFAVDTRYRMHHSLLPTRPSRRCKMREDPGADVDAFSDVQQLVNAIEKTIDAGTSRQAIERPAATCESDIVN